MKLIRTHYEPRDRPLKQIEGRSTEYGAGQGIKVVRNSETRNAMVTVDIRDRTHNLSANEAVEFFTEALALAKDAAAGRT